MPRLITTTALGLALMIALTGCNKGSQSETTSAPPVGGPGATAPGPPGPPGGPSTPPGGAPGAPAPAGGNAALTAKVKNALMLKKVSTAHLAVETASDGSVTLKGSVPTAGQKTLAEKSAKQVTGVTSVANQLTVAP